MLTIRKALLVTLPCFLFYSAVSAQTTHRDRAGNNRRNANRPKTKVTIEPTHKDVKYGPHERNRIDFYKAESKGPTPLVVYIHGGGFRGGRKTGINQQTLRDLLNAGISVAAIEYRLVPEYPLPTAHRDSLRALQFIRTRAKNWNINKTRIGAFGGSAGAQICMWLAFHDEMSDPQSDDPIQRESSRLHCVATTGGQTTMDFTWWQKNIPGYTKPHRPRSEYFGQTDDEQLKQIITDISAQSLITADDPPIWMRYGMAPGAPPPSQQKKIQGWKVHHVAFGIRLKEMMDALGIESYLNHPGKQTQYNSIADFFITKLSSP